MRRPGRTTAALVAALALVSAVGCSPDVPRGEIEVRVPPGASATDIAWRLHDAGLVEYPRVFGLVARVVGSADRLKAGRYRFPADASWAEILRALEEGVVVTVPLTVPEGLTLREVAPRLAGFTGVPDDSILRLASDTALARDLDVPGPTLEGYLFPDTYRFAEGVTPLEAIRAMVDRYHAYWTAERRARADSIDLDERGIVTLASIVEEEARYPEERPVIAGVYWNRLRRGMLLQADPTVQYALGGRRERLLYRDIDSVADNPYNTYTQPGLPPGPICSPGAASLDAALWPADVPWLFFVARPDGSHAFTRTAREHVNAKNRIRREAAAQARAAAAAAADSTGG